MFSMTRYILKNEEIDIATDSAVANTIGNTIEEIYLSENNGKLLIPLLAAEVVAGVPSTAENFIERALDLNDLLIQHPAATFYIRVRGDSMINAGIAPNDILIVDKSLPVSHNKIIIARINDELTVKRICFKGTRTFLLADNHLNAEYKPIEIVEGMDFEVWGVVTSVIHRV
jgi:DNA polymerase V